MSIKIGYIGLTHLGMNYLTSSLNKNYKVVAYDEDKKKIENLKNDIIEYNEPKLRETIIKKKNRIKFTNNPIDLKECKIIFFSQDVETDIKNISNIKKIKTNINNALKFLKNDSIFVVLSQVSLGFTRKIKFNKRNLYYQVETLVFGNAVNMANHPERIILGTGNKTNEINSHYNTYLKKFNCPIITMNYESAELTKKAINIFLCASITATNQFTELCEKTNADWEQIKNALIMDKRIGKYSYINPALGITGGNLERDIKSIEELNKKFNINNKFIQSINLFSKLKKEWVINIIKKMNLDKQKIKYGILGLSYKKNTDSLKNSTSIKIIKKISKFNKVFGYDPKARSFKTSNFERLLNIKDVLVKSDILIIMTPWDEFKRIESKVLIKFMKKKIIIDPYNVIQDKKKFKNIRFFSLGKNNFI